MVKLTIVGRLSDGLCLAKGPSSLNEEHENFSFYKRQGEFILREISRGALPPSKMTIRADHHCFNSLIKKVTRPYCFVKFDGVIGNIRKQYIDTRTQANLSKLNANRKQDLDIATENLSEIIERWRYSEILERPSTSTSQAVSPIWCSPRLEVIAMKWTPITVTIFVVTVVLWATISMQTTIS
ncbi:25.3 kDa vesicle transport protein [Prunus yedoensis var. nudiflora]|uniref:25.3 kDa vesicle transport protein n=1 Tax=Prunus yedoensis var. nudiflora TaxID=2094558 RepID=A0A314Y9R0_PRUYE|nr:25.3 kDa vesicle transport protein [Prunus yedoensis var. nudiflora]